MSLRGWFRLIPLASGAGGDDGLGIDRGPRVVEAAGELVVGVNDSAVAGFLVAADQEGLLYSLWDAGATALDPRVEWVVALDDSVFPNLQLAA